MKIKEMILISMFASLTAIGAFIKIPTPTVPFTLQFMFCAYAGILLGAKYGLFSQLLYISIGLIGIPIFTYGGGFKYIYQPTFGYILGFAFSTYVIGKLTENKKNITVFNILIPTLIGLVITYIIGIPYLYYMVNYSYAPISFSKAIAIGCTPFIIQDILKCIIVATSSVKVIPILRQNNLIVIKESKNNNSY